MLYTGSPNHFNWSVNNFSDTYMCNSAATTLTGNTLANTMGNDTAMLTGIAFDAYAIAICFSLGSSNATIRRQLTDILVDNSAGVGNVGASWTPLVSSLLTNSPSMATSQYGHWFYFPLFIPAGTAVGGRIQDTEASSATTRVSVRLYGQPSNPSAMNVGTKVQTLGAVTGTTSGTTVVPGTGALGSYTASLGTLTNAAWWWQLGVGSSDATITANTYRFDIAHDATSKYICTQGIVYTGDANENTGKTAFGEGPPVRAAPVGTDVYVRGSGQGAPDTTMSCVVYAVS
jgi:hypothetical protein